MIRFLAIWFSVFVVLASFISTSLTSPTPSKANTQGAHTSDTSSAGHQLGVPSSPGHCENDLTLYHRKARVPRAQWMIDYMDEGWALYFSVYQQYLHLTDAAAALEFFFTSVKNKALNDWATMEPLKAFVIEVGQLVLEFWCEHVAIPWNFVAMFAERMANSAATGFSGGFKAILHHVISNGAVFVTFKMRPDVAPAA